MPRIKVIRAVLDVIEIDGKESLALRGIIDPGSLKDILVPPYQREILNPSKIEKLKRALRTSRVPDIDLGMRGEDCRDAGEGVFYLGDGVYVIDGLQRKTAGEQLVNSGEMPHIGALIHFNTTEPWERARFTALNTGQTDLSNNIMLRNLAEEHPGADVMLQITSDRKFVLCDKVTWTQNMRVGDRITAITYYKVVGRLMSHAGPGKSGPIYIATGGADKFIQNVGKSTLTHNVREFFQLIEETFGITNIAYRSQAVQLKTSFLLAMAGVVSDHENFWTGDRLTVPPDYKKKIAQFPIADTHVAQLAGSSGKAVFLLEQLLIDHINSSKRSRRLRRRKGAADMFEYEEETSLGDEQ